MSNACPLLYVSGHFTSRFFDWMLMMYDSRDDNSKIFLMMTMNESLEAGYLKDQSAAQVE